MALNLAGLMAPLAAPPRPEQEFERTFYGPQQHELAQQLQQAQISGLQQQMQQARAMGPLQQQMEQQQLAQARKMGPLQQQLAQQQAAEARTKALFTPEQALQQALQAQQLKNQATLKTAQLKAQADNPFEKARATRMDKDLGTVNERANDAVESSLPLLNNILKAAKAVPLGTGPLSGRFLWVSREGQYLKSLLVQNQAKFLKTVHLGRMTQIEFDLLKKARGESTMYRSALMKLIKNQIEKAKLDVAKQHLYNTYVAGGGRNPDEISGHWSKQVPNLTKQIAIEVGEPTEGPQQLITPTTSAVTGPIMPKDQWMKLARQNPKSTGVTDAALSAYYDANYGGKR